ncbi:beta-1,6-N-acetylglucosaminyltransferase [Azospirillum sp. B4]|uniref:beta-1,6-N-acetylglucosaminyltransferase n=1 Tax=Azospirillum sp. B4 TaxID=95605 RepID=UPI0003465FD0|nr:beta-1,6-N-acetylglucosaminyltransferase [Azospirillum sp. B4]
MANCYFITCHRALDHVSDLFRFIYRSQHLYIFHCDPKAPAAVRDFVARLGVRFPNVIALPGQPYSWGGYSMVTTTAMALRVALAAPVPWRHFFWLSEQHLPLFSQDDGRWNAPAGWSFSDASLVTGMYPGGQDDVLHRFSLDFRELPGVGMFGVAPQAVDAAFRETLYHGSNWLVLDRLACADLLDRMGQPGEAEPFARSAQPDETMLQTLLMTGQRAGRHRIHSWNATYVAWPHLCGNSDMYCTLENVAAARGEGRLFIRKRPVVLPPELRDEMEAMAAFTADALAADLGGTFGTASTVSVDADLPIRCRATWRQIWRGAITACGFLTPARWAMCRPSM